MGISDQVRSKLANILFSPASQKIGGEGFLHPHLTHIFFITQHSVDGGGTPFRFACHRFDPMLLQIPFDFAYPIALNVELKDFANDLGLLRHNLKNAIRPFRISQKLRMVQDGFPAPHTVADTEFDIFAAEMAFGLIQRRELVDHTVANVHSV